MPQTYRIEFSDTGPLTIETDRELSQAELASVAESARKQYLSTNKGGDLGREVQRVAKNLKMNPDDLHRIIQFESGGNPQARNKSGATGLIQFMPSTAKSLGTTTDDIAKMSIPQQMDLVEKYFRNVNPKGYEGMTFGDIYSAVLFPAAIGKKDDAVLFGDGAFVPGYAGKGAKSAYEQNKGLDINKDGRVTKLEAASRAGGTKFKIETPVDAEKLAKAYSERDNLQQVIRAKEGQGQSATKERQQLYVLQNYLQAEGNKVREEAKNYKPVNVGEYNVPPSYADRNPRSVYQLTPQEAQQAEANLPDYARSPAEKFASSLSDPFGGLVRQFGVSDQEYTNARKDDPMVGAASSLLSLPGNLVSGASTALGGLAGFAGVAIPALQEGSNSVRQKLERIGRASAGKATGDPIGDFIGNTLPQGVGSMAPFAVAGRSVAGAVKGAEAIGSLAGKYGPRIAGSVAEGGLESASNAGSSFGKALDNGVDPNVARTKTLQGFGGELAFNATLNALGRYNNFKSPVLKGAISSLLEGTQEAGQEYIGGFASGQGTKKRDALESFLAGAVLGGGDVVLGGGRVDLTPGAKAELQNNPSPLAQSVVQAASKPNAAVISPISNVKGVDQKGTDQVAKVTNVDIALTQKKINDAIVEVENEAQAQQLAERIIAATQRGAPGQDTATLVATEGVQPTLSVVDPIGQPQLQQPAAIGVDPRNAYLTASEADRTRAAQQLARIERDPTFTAGNLVIPDAELSTLQAEVMGIPATIENRPLREAIGVKIADLVRSRLSEFAPPFSGQEAPAIDTNVAPTIGSVIPGVGAQQQANTLSGLAPDAVSTEGITPNREPASVDVTGGVEPGLPLTPSKETQPANQAVESPESRNAYLATLDAAKQKVGRIREIQDEVRRGIESSKEGSGYTPSNALLSEYRTLQEEVNTIFPQLNEIDQKAIGWERSDVRASLEGERTNDAKLPNVPDVKRGKSEIKATLQEAYDNGTLFKGDEKSHKLAQDFIDALPDKVLNDLGVSVRDTGDSSVKGAYLGDKSVAVIAKNLETSKPEGAAFTVAHEIAHHLKRSVAPELYSKLETQFERELKAGFEVTGKLSSYPNLKGMTAEEILSNPEARAEAFDEWFADTIAQKGLDKLKPDERSTFRKAIDSVKDFVNGAVDFFRRRGMTDHADRAWSALTDGRVERNRIQGIEGRVRYSIEKGGFDAGLWDDKVALSSYVYRVSANGTIDEFANEMDKRLPGLLTEPEIQSLYAAAKAKVERDGRGTKVEDAAIAKSVGTNEDILSLPAAKNAFSSPLLSALASEFIRDSEPVTWSEEEEKATNARRNFQSSSTDDFATYEDKVVERVYAGDDVTLSASDQIAVVLGVEDLISQRLAVARAAKAIVDSMPSDPKAAEDAQIDLRIHQAKVSEIEAKIEKYSVALQKTGSALGRALNARKAIIDDTFVDPQKFEAEATIRKGKALTEDERKIIEQLGADLVKGRERLVLDEVRKVLTAEREKVEKKIAKLNTLVTDDAIAEAEKRLEAAKAALIVAKAKLKALNRNSKDAIAEEARLRGLVDNAEQKARSLDNYVTSLKRKNYAGPGMDLLDMYEKELNRLTLALNGTEDPTKIREIAASIASLRRELSKGREYVLDILTGRKTPEEVLAVKGESEDRAKDGLLDPKLKPLREKYDAVFSDLAVRADLIKREEISIRKARERIEEIQKQIASGNFTGPDRIREDDYASGKSSGIRERFQGDAVLLKLKDELERLRDIDKHETRVRDLKRDIQDIASRLDAGTLIRKEPSEKRVASDPALERLLRELQQARSAARAYLDASEPQGFFDSVRQIGAALEAIKPGARIGDLVSGAVVAVTERNPVSRNIDATLDAILFPKLRAKVGSAVGPSAVDLLDGLSMADAFSMAVTRAQRNAGRVYSRDTLKDIALTVQRGDGFFSEKYGDPNGLRLSRNSPNLAGVDNVVNSMARFVGVTDVVFRKLFREGVVSDMVDSMTIHAEKIAKKKGIDFDRVKYRQDILSNKDGQLDEILDMADLEASFRVFAEGSPFVEMLAGVASSLGSGKAYQRLLSAPMRKAFSDQEKGDRVSATIGDGMSLLFTAAVTRFPKIFFRLTDFATDFAIGAPKAAGLIGVKRAVGDDISVADRRRIASLVRRNLFGALIAYLVRSLPDEVEAKIGQWNADLKRVVFQGFGFYPARVSLDQIGGPFALFTLLLGERKVARLVKEGSVSKNEAEDAIGKMRFEALTNQPPVTGGSQFLETVTGDGDAKRFMAASLWRLLGLGLVAEPAREIDEQRNGVTRRFGAQPEDSFLGAVQKEWSTRIPVLREATPQSRAGVVYPSMPQEIQREFRTLNYSPQSLMARPAAGIDDALVTASARLRERLVVDAAKAVIDSKEYQAAKATGRDPDSRRGLLTDAVQAAISIATYGTALDLSKETINALAKHRVDLADEILSTKPGETPEIRADRLKRTASAITKAAGNIDRALIETAPRGGWENELVRREAIRDAIGDVIRAAIRRDKQDAQRERRLSGEIKEDRTRRIEGDRLGRRLVSLSK